MILKAWKCLLLSCALCAGAILGVIVLLVTYDVILRNLGARSPSWIVDATEYALPLATLLVAPWLVFKGEHIRLDIVVAHLPIKARIRIEKSSFLICALISFALSYYSVLVIKDSYETGSLVIKNVIFPEWWTYAPLPFCFLMIAVESLRQFFAKSDVRLADTSNN